MNILNFLIEEAKPNHARHSADRALSLLLY
jgi:hypothetical protein